MEAVRNTMQRRLVLGAVQTLKNHPTADEIFEYINIENPGISRATVYRNLGVLAKQGEIQRVSHLDAADRFDFNLSPHYHFRCDGCDKVFDVDMPHMPDLAKKAGAPAGFTVHSAEITFTGLCPACGS